MHILKNSLNNTYEDKVAQKKRILSKYQNVVDQSPEILKNYSEGIGQLKKLRLHPVLVKDGKDHLIDIYYNEESMNNFKNSCVHQLDKLKPKMQSLDN